jgi:hypothetical protein
MLLAPLEATTSTPGTTALVTAVDADACSLWNANGFAPQAITVDLGAPRVVGRLLLVPGMSPRGHVVHVVEVSHDGVTFEPRARYDGKMWDSGVFVVKLEPAARARFIRLRTESSPSWVAWFEIMPLTCTSDEPPVPPRASVKKPR